MTEPVSAEKISREEAVSMIDEYGIYALRGTDLADIMARDAQRWASQGRVQIVTVAEGTITFEDGSYLLDRSI